MGNKIIIVLIVILVLISIALSYAIYDRNLNEEDVLLNNSEQKQSINIEDQSLEEKENFVLNPPGKDEPIERKELHFKISESIAKEAPYLTIDTCTSIIPVVFKVVDEEIFFVKNNDSVEHTISLGNAQSFSVEANSTEEISLKFSSGTGVYGYGCDDSLREVGMLFVTE